MIDDRPEPPKYDPDGDYVALGGQIDRVSVMLRVFGNDVDPAEITSLLDCAPSFSLRKGEVDPTGRYRRVATTGSWLLKGGQPPTDGLESQVLALLGRLTSDSGVWLGLTQRFAVDIFCGLFLDGDNRGFALSPKVLNELCRRHLLIDFDIYSHDDSDDAV